MLISRVAKVCFNSRTLVKKKKNKKKLGPLNQQMTRLSSRIKSIKK